VPPDIKSLQQFVTDAVGRILYEESFPKRSDLANALVTLIDGVSKYFEEGKRLFPEIIATTTIDFFSQLPSPRIVTIMNSCEISEVEFKKGLKRCAPLAVDGWVIFFEIREADMRYGLVSVESSELSPSLYDHTVGVLKLAERTFPVLYIQNIGPEVVRLKGVNSEIHVCLNLATHQDTTDEQLGKLISHMVVTSDPSIRQSTTNYLRRTFEYSLRLCHGCLIGIVEASPEALKKLRESIDDAVYLENPIDIDELVRNFNDNRNVEASINLKSYKNIVLGMINSDGITIITTDSKVIAYNAFIKNSHTKSTDRAHGGARKRAYLTMISSACFICCYFQSQDGQAEIWSETK